MTTGTTSEATHGTRKEGERRRECFMQGHVYETMRKPLQLPQATADRELAINSVHPAPSLQASVCFYRKFQEWNHSLRFLSCPIRMSHRQNDAELCLPAHHSRVSLACFFERICFNHGTHAGEFGEPQCVFGIGWCARGPALNRSTSKNEL